MASFVLACYIAFIAIELWSLCKTLGVTLHAHHRPMHAIQKFAIPGVRTERSWFSNLFVCLSVKV